VISRRILLAAGVAATGLAVTRPRAAKGGHSSYFADINAALRREGIDRPVLIIDLDRLDRNIDRLSASARQGRGRRLRISVKSVPAAGLVDYIARRSGADAGMVFHRTFIQAMARLRPADDLLLGKPMPVATLARVYDDRPGSLSPDHPVQWLIDGDARLAQYLDFARTRGLCLNVSLEIDVGLHRGGYASPDALAGTLRTIEQHPDALRLAGLMGYDGQLLGLPGFLCAAEAERVKRRYDGFVQGLRQLSPQAGQASLTFNGAGSPSFRFHEDGSPLTDISVGSALVKPGHYDLPILADFEPAAFIATPILKRQPNAGIPTLEWLGRLMTLWDPNTGDMTFAYGGNWLAEPESPAGISRAGLYTSSNQEGYYLAPGVILGVDDFLFLRPTQSEAVLQQFGDLLGIRQGRIEQRWPVIIDDGAA
jgi:D-serine deaminase-like pyridoxal phosphate-dependent protein